MIRAILVDDELHCIERLSALLATHCKNIIHLMGAYQFVEEGIDAIEKLLPELVFLDVQIQDKTAFDLLLSLNNINFDIIFTTAFEQYGVQAIKFSAIDYLLKPVDPDDLKAAIEKLSRKKSKDDRTKQMEALFDGLKNPQGFLKS